MLLYKISGVLLKNKPYRNNEMADSLRQRYEYNRINPRTVVGMKLTLIFL
jgi:hypothetical protein